MSEWNPEKLTVTLNALTHGNVKGWVDRLRLNRQAIGVPGEGCGQHEPLVCQPKIVFDDQSAELFYEIEAQFYPKPTPGTYVILKEFMRGDPRFIFTSQRSPIAAIPFRLPMTWSDPWGKAAGADGGTGGTGFSEAAINTTAGDMTGFTGSGSNLTIDFQMGTGIFQPGALVYYNHRMAEGHAPRGTGFSVEFPKP